MDAPHGTPPVWGRDGVDDNGHNRQGSDTSGGDSRYRRSPGGGGHLVDTGWFPSLRFPLLGSRLETTFGLVALLVAIPAEPGQRARLHMPRGVGWTVAGAAQAVLLDPQDLGGGFRSLLLWGASGGPPLWSTRLSPAGGGVEGSRLRLLRDSAVPLFSSGWRGVVGGVVGV